MSTYSAGWNGSTLKFNGTGGVAVAPLTDLRAPDEPAEFDTTGSTDSVHSHGAGLHKHSISAACLGSNVPRAGSIVNVAVSIAGGPAATTVTYAQAFISQMSISGRKDGPIESNLTIVPGVSTLSPITYSNTIGDLGFNGSTFSFAGSALTGIVSASYTSNAAAIESTGAEVPTADTLYGGGLPDEMLTITCLGGPQNSIAPKQIGATVMSWNDGGTLGSGTNCKCMVVRPGGSIDGQTTTEYVFKVCNASATANN